jgi:hypothetical protein
MEDIVNHFLWSDIENWSWEKVMFYCDARLQLRDVAVLPLVSATSDSLVIPIDR